MTNRNIPLWMQLLRWYSLHSPFQRGAYRMALWAYQHLSIPDVEAEAALDQTLWLTLRLRIWVDYNIYCLGLYEKPLAQFFIRSLRPDAVVLDIGAYIGQYTLLAAKYAPRGQVVAFEPHPETFARLQAHITRNSMDNVQVFQKALGQHQGVLPLVLSKQASDSYLCQSASCTETIVEVEVTTLDAAVRDMGLQKVNLVKIDVEGAEGEVLRGAQETLRRFRPLLVMEVDRLREEAWGDSPQAILADLEQHGYALYTLEGWKIVPLSSYSIKYANIIAIPHQGAQVG